MDKNKNEGSQMLGWGGLVMLIIIVVGLLPYCDRHVLHLTGTADVPSYYQPPGR